MTASAPLIRSIAARRYAARTTRWLCFTLLAVLAPLSLLAWADSLLVLSTRWRWTALGLVILALLWAVISFFKYCRRPSLKEVTAALDQASPVTHGYVVSTSEEMTGKKPANALERELLSSLHAAAARLAAEAKPAHPWPGPLTVCLVLAATAAFFSMLMRENGLALRRALQPWIHLPYTTVALTAPSQEPALREPFTLTGQVSGRVPREARLSWTDGRSASVPIQPDGTFQYTLTMGLQRTSTFVAEAPADGRSAPLTLTPRRVPKVESYAFYITPPAYTGWPPTKESRPRFLILRRSEVALALRLDLPAKRVVFLPDNNTGSIELTPLSPNGTFWTAELGSIARTFSYRIEITDEKGTYQAEADPQMIVTRPDTPPKIESITHNADLFAGEKAPEEFTLKYRATDDIGLARAFVDSRALTEQLMLPPLDEVELTDRSRELNRSASVPIQKWRDAGVAPMDIVVITVSVLDNNTLDGPGITTSEPILFEMPFPQATGDGQQGENEQSQDSAGGKQTIINPLALQKELHRQILRGHLGLKVDSDKNLIAQQKAIIDHIDDWVGRPTYFDLLEDEPDPEDLEAVKIKHIKNARMAASLVSAALDPASRTDFRGRYFPAMKASAEALSHLIEAAKIEAAEAQKQKKKKTKRGRGGELKAYSLLKHQRKGSKSAQNEESKNQEIERAAAELEKLLREQQKLNQEARSKSKDPKNHQQKDGQQKDGQQKDGQQKDGQQKDGQQKDGQQKDGQQKDGQQKDGQQKDGQQKDGQQKDGQQKDGQQKDGQQKDGQQEDGQNRSPELGPLAERENALAERAREILSTLEGIGSGISRMDAQVDPKQAADALRSAREYQLKTAEAMRSQNLGNSVELGEKSAKALHTAALLTKSLLERAVRQNFEAQSHPPGYEALIQEYSRRISYDQ